MQKIAVHLRSRLPDVITLDDLVAAGMLGLLKFHHNFHNKISTKSEKIASFSTFASFRNKGAMLDEVCKSNWTPRSIVKKLW